MSLREAMRARAEAARAEGALEPIPTRVETVEDEGVRFAVRVVEHLREKRRAARDDRDSDRNPFLPYEEALHVADVSSTHVALLNKFNVLEDHLIVIPRAFEEQESYLTLADFDALGEVMEELHALFFYNAGPTAGASQRHKHLQFVPRDASPTRLEELYAAERELPFVWARAPVAGESAVGLHAKYLDLLETIGRISDPTAYNLLGTRELLVAVPRSREASRGVSVNALGFAGALLVPDEKALALVRESGPMAFLRDVGESR